MTNPQPIQTTYEPSLRHLDVDVSAVDSQNAHTNPAYFAAQVAIDHYGNAHASDNTWAGLVASYRTANTLCDPWLG